MRIAGSAASDSPFGALGLVVRRYAHVRRQWAPHTYRLPLELAAAEKWAPAAGCVSVSSGERQLHRFWVA